MLRITVMNSKGGCGKTTVATSLASYCSARGYGTALFDFDRQASATRWLKARPNGRTGIHGVAAFQPPSLGVTRSWQMRVPAHTRFLITDTPARISDSELDERVAEADIILIPVLPSSIDIHTTADFIRDLLLIGKARARGKRLGIIANRTRIRTKAMDKLERFLQSLDIPVIARVRDTQNYVRAAETGVGVHELEDRDASKDVQTWAEVLDWLEQDSVPDAVEPNWQVSH